MRKLALLLGVGILAACGSSGSSGDPSTNTSPPSSTTRPVDYCRTQKQAAIAATAAFYANSDDPQYPKTFNDLVDESLPVLELVDPAEDGPLGATLVSPDTVKGETGW